jgi:hypothetical protein
MNEPKYFDLHITGLGYLNRVREVDVKHGQNFLAVDVSAIHGAADAIEYTRFDCRVSGSEAQRVIRLLQSDIQARKAVLVGFKLGDLYVHQFVYDKGDKGDKAGQPGVSLKARLLRIAWAKVDGKTVYRAGADEEARSTAISVPAPHPAGSDFQALI